MSTPTESAAAPASPTAADSRLTTSQTIGPFPHEGWRWAFAEAGIAPSAAPAVRIRGQVLDGDGAPVSDAMLEAWVPNAAASPVPGLAGLHRVPTDDEGRFAFKLPAPQAGPEAGEPLALVTVFARGVLKHQFTAVFLADDPKIDTAPLLQQVPAIRRATLLARPDGDGGYRWDLRLQSAEPAQETVFFDYR